mmetsp:Transcript_17738/g.36368  ORF Transcript_17738/g.36368 Transcript_17738/m.36368 type:complete len:100 (+) Transcript_17738:53-352(+)
MALLIDNKNDKDSLGGKKEKRSGAGARVKGGGEMVLVHLEAAREAAARAGHTQILMEAQWLLAVTCARCGKREQRDTHAAELNHLLRSKERHGAIGLQG